MTPQDDDRRLNSPPLQGRGRGWGVSAERLAQLHARAGEMRRNPTEPEKRVWRILSGSQLGGYKFRRQAVLPPFIADFLCPSAKLVVEVDGDTHDEAKDRLRDNVLAEQAYRVVRVTNLDVMTNIEGVWEAIGMALASAPLPFRGGAGGGASPQAISPGEAPHPNPSPEGEGLKAQKLLGISLEASVG